MNEVNTRDDDMLTPKGDMAAANAGVDAQMKAREQLESGEMVSVAGEVTVDREALNEAYQRVLDRSIGEAFDPLVHTWPADNQKIGEVALVPDGATQAQVAQALRDSGAISRAEAVFSDETPAPALSETVAGKVVEALSSL
jgi:hypothetical protein